MWALGWLNGTDDDLDSQLPLIRREGLHTSPCVGGLVSGLVPGDRPASSPHTLLLLSRCADRPGTCEGDPLHRAAHREGYLRG